MLLCLHIMTLTDSDNEWTSVTPSPMLHNHDSYKALKDWPSLKSVLTNYTCDEH